ncbi:LOB domain-containing protein 4 [Platanthera zijinensis]|uniref:LOB domain-containing protein 4 n=1 Tax=Platanthera zijinensis TaxID=2320716 RepID=A0AAP0BL05_9ASPA
MLGRKPGAGGGLVSPCAACKLLRRRCAADCMFAPYFPADEPQKFATVHRVFGASNVNKLLQEVPMEQRTDAVSSLVYEADARVRDPVYGCVAAISSLQCQIDALHAQLAIAQAEMVRIRLHHAAYLARSTAATVAIAPFISDTSSSTPTTPSDNAGDVVAKKLHFGYDTLLEQAHVGQPMWSY